MKTKDSKIEFCVRAQPGLADVYLRLKSVYEDHYVYKMQEISPGFYQTYVDSNELPKEETQYHFFYRHNERDKVIPYSFLASKTNFTVKNFSHINRGASVSMYELKLVRLQIDNRDYLNFIFTSKLMNLSSLAIISDDAQIYQTEKFNKFLDYVGVADLIPISDLPHKLQIKIKYRDQVFYIDQRGIPMNDPIEIDYIQIPSSSLITTQAPRSIMFSKRDFKEILIGFEKIKDYGFNEIHLPPVFEAKSSHGYDWIKFGQLDSNLLSHDYYLKFIQIIKQYHYKIIQDICVTHCHESSEIFQDVSKNGKESPWHDFFIQDSFKPGAFCHYVGIDDLPLINLNNSEVRHFFLNKISAFLKEYPVDGIRFDCGNLIPKDFYNELLAKNNVKVLYESWSVPKEQFSLDGLYFTNYIIRERIFNHFNQTHSLVKLKDNLLQLFRIPLADLLLGYSFISSHDTELIEDFNFYRFCLYCIYILPGNPIIYWEELSSFFNQNSRYEAILKKDLIFLNSIRADIRPEDYHKIQIDIVNENKLSISFDIIDKQLRFSIAVSTTKLQKKYPQMEFNVEY